MKNMVFGLALVTAFLAGCSGPTEPSEYTWTGNIVEISPTDSTFLLSVVSTSRSGTSQPEVINVYVEARSSLVIRGSGGELISHDFADLEVGIATEVVSPGGFLPLSGIPPVLELA